MDNRKKYCKRISKDVWLKNIYKEIDKSEYGAIRPTELNFKASHFYWLIKCNPNELGSKKYGDFYTLLFRPGDLKKSDHRARKDGVNKSEFEISDQKLKFDFKPDIATWDEQLHFWHDFYNPWTHSVDVAFEGRLPLEYEPTYPYLKKFVKEYLEKNPKFCINPFLEQEKLKAMMKSFNILRDNILKEFKSIIKARLPYIKRTAPSFDRVLEQSLLEILFWRKTIKFLDHQDFDKLFSIKVDNRFFYAFGTDKRPGKKCIEIIEVLSRNVDKSKVINEKSIVELFKMISKSQRICNNIRRALKLLERVID